MSGQSHDKQEHNSSPVDSRYLPLYALLKSRVNLARWETPRVSVYRRVMEDISLVIGSAFEHSVGVDIKLL